MEILMFQPHTIQPITVGIQLLRFGMNKVRKAWLGNPFVKITDI